MPADQDNVVVVVVVGQLLGGRDLLWGTFADTNLAHNFAHNTYSPAHIAAAVVLLKFRKVDVLNALVTAASWCVDALYVKAGHLAMVHVGGLPSASEAAHREDCVLLATSGLACGTTNVQPRGVGGSSSSGCRRGSGRGRGAPKCGGRAEGCAHNVVADVVKAWMTELLQPHPWRHVLAALS
jgi:hypothetical protein